MSVRKALDHLISMWNSVERRERSDDVIAEIVNGLVVSGVYVAKLDGLTARQAVDFNWAAQQAGRRLGVRVHVDLVDGAGIRPRQRPEVRVACVQPLP